MHVQVPTYLDKKKEMKGVSNQYVLYYSVRVANTNVSTCPESLTYSIRYLIETFSAHSILHVNIFKEISYLDIHKWNP